MGSHKQAFGLALPSAQLRLTCIYSEVYPGLVFGMSIIPTYRKTNIFVHSLAHEYVSGLQLWFY